MNFPEIYSAPGLMELIRNIGFLPLLDSGIKGFSAEDIVTCLLYTSDAAGE